MLLSTLKCYHSCLSLHEGFVFAVLGFLICWLCTLYEFLRDWERPCASEDVHEFTLVYCGRKCLILCRTNWFMAQGSKRKSKASDSFSSDSDICSLEEKNLAIAHASYSTKATKRDKQTCRTRLQHNLRRFAKRSRASKAGYKI